MVLYQLYIQTKEEKLKPVPWANQISFSSMELNDAAVVPDGTKESYAALCSMSTNT